MLKLCVIAACVRFIFACQVAMITPYPFTPGGGERYFLTVLKSFQRMRCEITVMLEYSKGCNYEKCFYETVNMLGVEVDTTKIFFKPYTLYKKYDYSFLLGNEKAPQFRGLGTYNIYMCQFPFDQSRVLTQQEFKNMKTFDTVLLNSEYSFEKYVNYMKPYEKNKIPIPLVMYPSIEMLEYKTEKRRPIIVMIGRFFRGRQQKNQASGTLAFNILLGMYEMYSKLTDEEPPYLYIIGAHTDQVEFGNIICKDVVEKSSRASCYLNRKRKDVIEVLQKASVVWSLTGFKREKDDYADSEHFGIAVSEAMSAGCIPVLLNEGASKELVPYGSGRLVSSLEDLAKQTFQILYNTTEKNIQEMRLLARKHIEKFSKTEFDTRMKNLLFNTDSHLWNIIKGSEMLEEYKYCENKYAAIIVDTRVNIHLKDVFNWNINYLGNKFKVYFYHGTYNENFVKKSLEHVKCIEFINLNVSKYTEYDYNVLLKSANFWRKFLIYEHVLVFQTDVFLTRPFDHKFFDYDFVGAPWTKDNDIYYGINEDKKEIPKLPEYIRVGNGGFSLRRTECLVKISEKYSMESKPQEQEDVFMVRNMHNVNCSVAPPHEAAEFGLEVMTEFHKELKVKVMSFHQPWNYLNPNFYLKILKSSLKVSTLIDKCLCAFSRDGSESNCCYEGGSWFQMCGDEEIYSWEEGYYACNGKKVSKPKKQENSKLLRYFPKSNLLETYTKKNFDSTPSKTNTDSARTSFTTITESIHTTYSKKTGSTRTPYRTISQLF